MLTQFNAVFLNIRGTNLCWKYYWKYHLLEVLLEVISFNVIASYSGLGGQMPSEKQW